MKGLMSIILIFLILSCGRDYSDPNSVSSAEIGSNFEVSSVISDEALLRGRNICDALRNKRIKIQTSTSLSRIAYNVLINDCGGSENRFFVETRVSRSVAGNPTITPLLSSDEFRSSLITDERGFLASFCADIFAGQAPSVIRFLSTLSVELIEFPSADTVRLKNGLRATQSSNFYTTLSVRDYSVRLGSSSNLDYGYIYNYEESTECANDPQNTHTYEHFIESAN